MAKKRSAAENYTWEEEALAIPIPISVIRNSKPVETDEQKNKRKKALNKDKVKTLLQERSEKISTSKGILEVHPDLQLAKEITTAQILSPKDLSDYEFRLSINKALYKEKFKPEALINFTESINLALGIEDHISTWLGDILFDHGAVAHLIMPPANIDKMLSETKCLDLESFDSTSPEAMFSSRNILELGDMSKMGIESVIDDYRFFLREDMRERLVETTINANLDIESFDFGFEPDIPQEESKVEKGSLVIDGPEEEKRNVNAIHKRIPVDIILPIAEPSDKSRHRGYIILADEHSHLSSSAEDSSFMSDLLERLKKATHDDTSKEYNVIKDIGLFNNHTKGQEKQTIAELMEQWVEMVSNPIEDAIKKSNLVHGDIDVKEHENFYKILLARALRKKKTRLIFVPASMVSYMAFEYNEMGHGVSLLEKTAYYSSIRAVLQVASLLNAINNSIPATDVNIQLDEDDEDPMGTIETIMHELAAMTTMNFPVGSVDPSEIMTSIQRAAYRVKVQGGTMFPGTSTELSDTQRSKVTFDGTDLDDHLRRKQYAGIGVSPEAIDQSLQGEFATQIVLNDILAAKRAMSKQRTLKKCLKALFLKFTSMSPRIIKQLKADGISNPASFVKALYIVMPTADTSRIEQHADTWDKLSRFVDEVMPSIVSDDMLRGIAGIDSDYTRDMLDDVRSIFGSAVKREWLRENNVLPDIWRTIDPDKETGMSKEISDHYRDVFKAAGPMIKAVLKGIKKTDTDVAKWIDGNLDDDEESEEFRSTPRPGTAVPFSEDGEPFTEPEEETDLPSDDEVEEPSTDDPSEETEETNDDDDVIDIPGSTQE